MFYKLTQEILDFQPKVLIFFHISPKGQVIGILYGNTNGYAQCIFTLRNKKNILLAPCFSRPMDIGPNLS